MQIQAAALIFFAKSGALRCAEGRRQRQILFSQGASALRCVEGRRQSQILFSRGASALRCSEGRRQRQILFSRGASALRCAEGRRQRQILFSRGASATWRSHGRMCKQWRNCPSATSGPDSASPREMLRDRHASYSSQNHPNGFAKLSIKHKRALARPLFPANSYAYGDTFSITRLASPLPSESFPKITDVRMTGLIQFSPL